MRLTRSQGFAERLAGRRFTNRTRSLALFTQELAKLEKDPQRFHVISFYGMGGIGKTALLKELRDRHSGETVTWVRLDLESTVVTSPIDAIYEIYREAGLRDFMVEYTLALIWEHRGRSIEDIRNRLISTEGVFAEVADIALSAAESFVGARTIRRMFDASVDTARRNFGDSAATVDLLDTVSDSEREQLLVELMAKAIRRHAEEGRRYIFGIDSLHWMKRREGYLTSDRAPDDWLLDLIGGAQAGLWLLTSREKLKWAEEMPDWRNFLEEHLLGSLSEEDCDDFLRSVPVTHPEIAAKIKKSSRGIPIFLDLAASLYLSVAGDTLQLAAADFEFDPTNLVQRYLSHLDRTHSEAIELLALFDEFDGTLAQTLFYRWHLRISVRDYREICSSILALPLEQEFGTHRIHTDIRETIVRKLGSEEIALACEALVDLLWDRIFGAAEETRNFSYLAWIFGRALNLINTQIVRLGGSAASRLFLIGHRLIEAGYHDGFADQILAHANDWGEDSRETEAAMAALDAFLLRRGSKLSEAQRRWASLPEPLDEVLTPGASSLVRYLQAHTEHLLGRYEDASRVYRTVLDEAEAGLRSAPHLLLARRQLADIDMLSGRFDAALSGFSAELHAGRDRIWRAETLRHVGHLYRFNFQFDKAYEMYLSADRIATDAEAEIVGAKILTNFTELTALGKPEDSVNYAERAIRANSRFNNRIEVGKCQAAAAIAFARLGNFYQAEKMAADALATQRETGYRSGVIFAHGARCIVEDERGEQDAARQALGEVETLSDALGVYRFYRAHLRWKLYDQDPTDGDLAQWLAPTTLIERMRDAFRSNRVA